MVKVDVGASGKSSMNFYKAALNTCYYSRLQSLSKPYLGGLGSILMLHHVRAMPTEEFSPNQHLTITPEFLDQLLEYMSYQYAFITMDEAADRIDMGTNGKGRRPFLAVTLDDGYRDNIENAIPVFRKHNVPYMIYLAPGLIEGKCTLWWEDVEAAIASLQSFYLDMPNGREHFETSTIEQKRDVYQNLMEHLFFGVSETEQREVVESLSVTAGHNSKAHATSEIAKWRELKVLAKDPLCSFGAHTLCHNVLSKLGLEEARFEIEKSRDIIQAETGKLVKHFAYPYGFPKAAASREFQLVSEAGFATGVTTRKGVIYPEHMTHMSALPRITLNGHFQSIKYVETLLSGLPTRLSNFGRKLDVA